MSDFPMTNSISYGGNGNLYSGETRQFSNVGDMLGRFFNDLTGKSASNQFSAEQAKESRDWSEYMASTAYQRSTQDMKAAGLNPASLSGDGSFSPASAPSGAAAHASEGGMNTPVGMLIRSAMAALTKGYTAKLTSAAYTAAHNKSDITAAVSNTAKNEMTHAKAFSEEVERVLKRNQEIENALLERNYVRDTRSIFKTGRNGGSGV